MDCATKVQFIVKTLKSTYLNDGLEEFVNRVETEGKLGPVNALDMELELAFRTLLDEISQDRIDNMLAQKSSVRQLLRFSFALIHKYRGASSAKGILRVPYLLFADLLDGQTIEGAEKLWDLVESSIEQLTDPQSFNSGRFIILKACNTLLRRLSKSCNPELCGRVLLFLSAAYDINERSAVNHLGRINIGNATTYEDEKTFREAERLAAAAAAQAAAAQAASSSTSTGVAEEGAMEVAEMYADLDQNESKEGDDDKEKEESFKKRYYLYRMFWGLQSYMSAENSKFTTVDESSTAAAQPAARKGAAAATAVAAAKAAATTTAKARWSELMEHANTVLGTFERSEYSEQELQAMMSSSSSTSAGSGEEKYMGCKYLTSSELLSLQIRDPLFRQQLAAQILFYVNHLRFHPISLVAAGASTSAATTTAPATTISTSKLVAKGGKKEPEGVPEGSTDGSTILDIKIDLDGLERRAYALLEVSRGVRGPV